MLFADGRPAGHAIPAPLSESETLKLELYQVDAFADRPFGGNPAAVCPLDQWLPDDLLQAIAMENNLSETAYFVRKGDIFELRWFTPAVEVDLCGHATLATAWVIFNEYPDSPTPLRFATRSGELRVSKAPDGLTIDFPATIPVPCAPPRGLLAALGLGEGEVLEADDYIVVVEDEAIVRDLRPDINGLRAFPKRGVAVTAPGTQVDFVSRWFGPNVGVNEDPVTGSAHTWLAPYWAKRLGKQRLTAEQGGARKGQLVCEKSADRVFITGKAALYLKGTIHL